jgi:hypothetical protein
MEPLPLRKKPKGAGGKHPYAAIEHRVMDSPAFADLSGAAVRVLLVIARQLSKDNNGQLQATYSYCRRYGIGSEHTLQGAIAELIAHGFIYRTRSHGANRAWARYAVTWLPIGKNREGLFLESFEACAWRHWQADAPQADNSHGKKKAPRKNCRIVPAESAVSPPDFLQ